MEKLEADLEDSPSIQIETRVKPNDIITVDKEDKESKSVISEKKIVDIPIVPRPEQPQEHSLAPVRLIYAPKQTIPHLYSTLPAHLHQQLHQLHRHQSNPYYLRTSKPLQNLYDTTTSHDSSISLYTNATSAQVAIKTTPDLLQSSFQINDSFLIPPSVILPPKFRDVTYPRPAGRPQTYPKRAIPMKIIDRYPSNMSPMRFKKFFTKYPYQSLRPYMEFVRPNPNSKRQPFPLMPYSFPIIAVSSKVNAPPMNKTVFANIEEVVDVEVSPQQASTEREPEIQTASTSNIVDIPPIFIGPAVNTGFKPSSIKMETGFKPIITKEFQDRMDHQNEEEIDIEDEGETGIIDKDSENNYQHKPIHAFEPMFVPSPTDKFIKGKIVKFYKRPAMKKHHHYLEVIIKQPRSFNETQDELVAEAAERSETYYLPPKGQPPVGYANSPSNIDIETPYSDINIDSPPDIVVTYDGKRVSGQSLTAKISDRPTAFETRISKASTFIQARPQFVKFTGELPPLNTESLFGGVQQKTGVLSRELDTPVLPSANNGATTSIKLSRVNSDRRKRAAIRIPNTLPNSKGEIKRK